MPQYSYKIGTSVGTKTNIESLATPIPPPRSTYQPYTEPVQLGNGMVRGAGYPVATWHWGFITRAQRDQLRQYCTGPSATVYIDTKGIDSTDTYVAHSAVVIWPQGEERESKGDRVDFTLTFRCYA